MLLKMKAVKWVGIFSFAVLMSIYSCTKGEDKPAEQTSDQHQKTKADTVITKSTILLLGPDEEEIDEIKKRQGEDNFYTIADDANYYSAEIFEAAPATIYTGYRIIGFPKENYVFDKNKSEDKWLVIDYKAGSQPKIYSLVDYYRHITEK
ncbi:hypothetical protein [Chryseobacterium sp. BIGb0232]|uniref:hypothetical protein n=1 Tax=Chryseobacterium sp. BIGb0232 TaxID=2940598 RepID=UPI000FBCBBC5|nr:hypothetical protein [Chryseobacterium sp. BIGb0232]MCS4301117.1 hypothetical protein [Chryseobacterium sp. BIGb0232]ROS20022.1 hypothetical protein EDF65_0723 [Chryseobacterium nakagawai]